MTVLRGLYLEMDEETQDLIDAGLSKLIQNESHIVQVDLNLAYALQVMRRRGAHRRLKHFLFKYSGRAPALSFAEKLLSPGPDGSTITR